MQEVEKNARGEVYRLEHIMYKGHDLLSLRLWYTAKDGTKRPTKKGMTIPITLLPQIIGAMQAAVREKANVVAEPDKENEAPF